MVGLKITIEWFYNFSVFIIVCKDNLNVESRLGIRKRKKCEDRNESKSIEEKSGILGGC